jgi:hypothetical protein
VTPPGPLLGQPNITESRDRIVTADIVFGDVEPIERPQRGQRLAPYRVTITYHGVTVDDADAVPGIPAGGTYWVVNIHVSCWVIGKRGDRPTAEHASAWYATTSRDHPDDRADWPWWLVVFAERWHPARGGPDNDPEGSYL